MQTKSPSHHHTLDENARPMVMDHRVDQVVPRPIAYERFGFCWSAVLAGLVTAVALNVMFAQIAFALNLGIVDASSSVQTVAIMNGIAWVVTGLIALFVGAWVAGTVASARSHLDGGLHGIAVWGAGAIVTLVLGFSAAGALGGGMVFLVGKGLEGAGGVARGAGQLAAPAWDGIRTELEEAADRVAENPADAPRGTEGAAPANNADNRLMNRSRLLELAGEHFTVDGEQSPAEEEELVSLIASETGISKDAAKRTLAQWDSVWDDTVQKYENAKARAAETAEKSRKVAIGASLWAAVAMLLGGFAAFSGGALGTTMCLGRSAMAFGSLPLRVIGNRSLSEGPRRTTD